MFAQLGVAAVVFFFLSYSSSESMLWSCSYMLSIHPLWLILSTNSFVLNLLGYLTGLSQVVNTAWPASPDIYQAITLFSSLVVEWNKHWVWQYFHQEETTFGAYFDHGKFFPLPTLLTLSFAWISLANWVRPNSSKKNPSKPLSRTRTSSSGMT